MPGSSTRQAKRAAAAEAPRAAVDEGEVLEHEGVGVHASIRRRIGDGRTRSSTGGAGREEGAGTDQQTARVAIP